MGMPCKPNDATLVTVEISRSALADLRDVIANRVKNFEYELVTNRHGKITPTLYRNLDGLRNSSAEIDKICEVYGV